VRAHGLERIDDVREAVLETDGSISVIPRDRPDTGRVGEDASAKKKASG
jgi:uncharacterized membrane protein YcaP (DUF421 family)